MLLKPTDRPDFFSPDDDKYDWIIVEPELESLANTPEGQGLKKVEEDIRDFLNNLMQV